MKDLKLTWFILAIGIFILIFSALLGSSIAYKYSEINGIYETNKVTANLISNEDLSGESAFTREDIRHLQQFSFKNTDVSYAAEDKTIAAYEKNQTKAYVTGVSDKYNMFHQITLQSGSFITPGNRGERVAVVDEELAIELFNNINVLGLYVDIYGQKFRIIGVIASDMSIIQTLTDNGDGSIYIPIEHMLEFDEDSVITFIEARASDRGTTGKNINTMKEALASIGKNASDYKIIDCNVEKIVADEKVQRIAFIPGTGIIALLLLSIKKRVKDIYTTFNSALREDYLKNVLKIKYMKLSLMILEIIALLALVYLVWNTVKFSVYVPAEFIPDELIDTGFFSELFKSLMQNRVQNAGYIPSSSEMEANALSMMLNWNLFICMLVGLPLYCLGLKLLETKYESAVKHLLYCCAIIAFSVMLSLLILKIFNMPAVVNNEGVLIIFTFVFLSAGRTEPILPKKQSKNIIKI